MSCAFATRKQSLHGYAMLRNFATILCCFNVEVYTTNMLLHNQNILEVAVQFLVCKVLKK